MPRVFSMTNKDAIRSMAVAIQTPGIVLSREKTDRHGNVVKPGRQPLGLPVLLWGPPGVAKTAFVSMIARELGYHLVTVLASLREPSDFLGLPLPKHDRATGATEVKMAPPDWAIELNIHSDNPRPAEVGQAMVEDPPGSGHFRPAKRALLFLDEFTTAPKSVQAALLRVVHERVVGDMELNANVAVIAAANPPYMSPGGEALEPPTANRFIHLDWKPLERDVWADYIEGKPATVQIPRIPDRPVFDFFWGRTAPVGAGFIRSFGQTAALDEKKIGKVSDEYRQYAPLFNMPDYRRFKMIGKKASDGFDPTELAWPSPRSWELALRAAAGTMAAQAEDVTTAMMCGSIGAPLCKQFAVYVKNADLKPPEHYVEGNADPKFGSVRMDQMSVMLTQIANFGLQPDKANATVEWLWSYADVNRPQDGWPLNQYDMTLAPQYERWRDDPERGAVMAEKNPTAHATIVGAWNSLEQRVRSQEKGVLAGVGF